jgi:hypothetical protein
VALRNVESGRTAEQQADTLAQLRTDSSQTIALRQFIMNISFAYLQGVATNWSAPFPFIFSVPNISVKNNCQLLQKNATPAAHLINQPTNQPTNQLTNEQTNETTDNQPTNQKTKQPTKMEPTNQ